MRRQSGFDDAEQQFAGGQRLVAEHAPGVLEGEVGMQAGPERGGRLMRPRLLAFQFRPR
jgi:hypothetical protein